MINRFEYVGRASDGSNLFCQHSSTLELWNR